MRPRNILPWWGLLVGLFGCPPAPPSELPPPPAADPGDLAAAAEEDPSLTAALADATMGVKDPELARLLRDHWAFRLLDDPVYATQLGVHAYDDRVDDRSLEAKTKRRAARRSFLDRAQALDVASPEDRVTHALFVEELAAAIASEVCEFDEWSVDPRSNPITEWNYLADLMPVTTLADGRRLVARYRAVPAAIDQTSEALGRGAARGWFATAESTRRVLAMVKDQLATPVADWPLAAPAKTPKPGWSEAEREAFATDLIAAVRGMVPALERYRDRLEELLPRARPPEDSGLGALPGGEGCYRARIRAFTTLDETPKAIFDVGEAEIARIDCELLALGRKLGLGADLPDILAALRSDPSLYFESEEEVEAAAAATLKAAKKAIPAYFGRLPEADCVVRRVPDYEAPFTTIAYYRPPHPDGSKPGEYFVNVLDPPSRPRFQAKVLAVHEAIPGHHLQIAIAQELPAVPAFRRHGGFTAFVEGWGLYSERLAGEMGLYATDLDRLGVASFDAWRAGRLVVDTGIHAFGWSRERAKQYLMDHTALAAKNIDNEVDRYISWPGQALA
ncbi:MAG: DUF885 domain-containing protein, partial [Myxococcales bacterium]|nr:DUF885 domain-containing protein [Myxococcales bacterium]